ncbi:MAG: S-layer homology domain-containing protein, partial [Bacillota bacterium]|nr:S-layer homology domain-containing protein [Bacillota bacterium]
GSFDYVDVLEKDWFYEAVRLVTQKGAMKGIGNKKFGPRQQMTRGMVVTLLYQMNGQPVVDAVATYPDVESGKYYSIPVAWASKNKLIKGYSNGNFGPNDLVTREQLVAILYRYADFMGYDVTAVGDLTPFGDKEKVSAYAMDAVKFAVGSRLMRGDNLGMLNPKGFATRAEVATFVMNFYKQLVK